MALTRPKIWDLDTNIEYFVDPITVINSGATQANVDVGFLVNRAQGLVSNVALYWSESAQSFVTAFTSNDGTTNSNITIGSYANLTVGNSTVTNSVTAGKLYTTSGLFWAANGISALTGINYTSSNTVPASAKVGDQWYYQAADILYEYISDGTQNIWVDISSTAAVVGTSNSVAGNLTVNGNLSVTANTYLTGTIAITGNTTVIGNIITGSHYITSNATTGTVTRVEANVPHPFMLMGAA
jgi:hypothetical protein